MYILGIILLVVSFSVFLLLINADEDMLEAAAKWLILICWIMGILGSLFLAVGSDKNIPKAIEVYQGKTTLRIIYENGIPVDSSVVYK